MTYTNGVGNQSDATIAGIVARIRDGHRDCCKAVCAGAYDRAADSLRDSRRLLGELLLTVDSGDCWHRALVHQVGRHHAACSRLVCVARGIQADEALLMLRARDCERETGGIDSALAAADGRPPRTTGRMEKRALT
jgi:hypothetical protein